MSVTTEDLYRSARPLDFHYMISEESQFPVSFTSFDDRDLVEWVEHPEHDVAGFASGIVLRTYIVNPKQEPWLDSVPSFDHVEVGQKFLLDKATADSISWLVECIDKKRSRFFLRKSCLEVDIFVLYKIAAGTSISYPYVVDSEINPDGHVVIRSKDSDVQFEIPIFVQTNFCAKCYSPILANDLCQAEKCGVLLIASRKVGPIRSPMEGGCNMDMPNRIVRELARAVAYDLHHCSLEDYEILTGWMEKAERANFALSCMEELAELGRLYDAVEAVAIYDWPTLDSLIDSWRSCLAAESDVSESSGSS